jgi:hypothetical protein
MRSRNLKFDGEDGRIRLCAIAVRVEWLRGGREETMGCMISSVTMTRDSSSRIGYSKSLMLLETERKKYTTYPEIDLELVCLVLLLDDSNT